MEDFFSSGAANAAGDRGVWVFAAAAGEGVSIAGNSVAGSGTAGRVRGIRSLIFAARRWNSASALSPSQPVKLTCSARWKAGGATASSTTTANSARRFSPSSASPCTAFDTTDLALHNTSTDCDWSMAHSMNWLLDLPRGTVRSQNTDQPSSSRASARTLARSRSLPA